MANGFLTTSELDFQYYRENLKLFLSQQDLFKDYNFEGSNMSVLLDILAYNTYMNGVYLNMVGSEMFLDTAVLRESIVSHAKELNYTPRSRTAAVSYVDITIDPEGESPDTITIPKYYEMSGRSAEDTTLFFTTDEAIVVRANNGVYRASNVAIYEGNIVKEVFIANTSARYLLQSANVDVASISVTVKDSNTSTTETKWNKETFLFGLDNTDSVYFVQGAEDHLYELVFGNGDIGKRLVDGNMVTVTYRETSGIYGNGIERFSAPNSIEGYGSISVRVIEPSQSGAEHETDEEIKFNAPRYFPTQNRAVTVEDFIALTRQQFPSLQVVTAFGGEETEPKQYGKVIIAAKPFGGNKISTPLKNQIYNFLKERSSISIDPVVVDAEYFYAEVVTEVLYNINNTTRSAKDIEALVEQTISTFGSTNLEKFGADLRFSKLCKAIDDCEDAIISNNTELRIIRQVLVETGVPTRISFSFENQLKQGTTNGRVIYVDAESTIESSLFTYNLNDVDYQAKIKDDSQGNLMVVSTVNGVVQLLADKVGTVNYATGEVSIGELTFENISGTTVQFYGRTEKYDIETRTNKILLISPAYIVVRVNGIRE